METNYKNNLDTAIGEAVKSLIMGNLYCFVKCSDCGGILAYEAIVREMSHDDRLHRLTIKVQTCSCRKK
jgi:hypothetical protein